MCVRAIGSDSITSPTHPGSQTTPLRPAAVETSAPSARNRSIGTAANGSGGSRAARTSAPATGPSPSTILPVSTAPVFSTTSPRSTTSPGAGVRCTVSTDDPLCFANTLVEEYETLVNDLAFTRAEIAQLVRNGWEVADVTPAMREAALQTISRIAAAAG